MIRGCTFKEHVYGILDGPRPEAGRSDLASGPLQSVPARADRVRAAGAGRRLRARRHPLARHGQPGAAAQRVRPRASAPGRSPSGSPAGWRSRRSRARGSAALRGRRRLSALRPLRRQFLRAYSIRAPRPPGWRSTEGSTTTWAACSRRPSRLVADRDVPHLFAAFFQIRRAFHHIFHNIIGGSAPGAACAPRSGSRSSPTTCAATAARSIARMGDITTLITGPSGTGKELVARRSACRATSRSTPRRRRSPRTSPASFYALNLVGPVADPDRVRAVRPPRGAFTGALEDRRAGWRSARRSARYSSTRSASSSRRSRSSCCGCSRPGRSSGSATRATGASTARSSPPRTATWPARCAAGRFRKDFYYRLCSDMIAHARRCDEQLRDAPGELRTPGALPRRPGRRATSEAERAGRRRPSAGSTGTSAPDYAGRATSASWSSACGTC